MSIQRRHFSAALGLAASSLAAPWSMAQTGKTVRILVGFPPGGGTDAIARMLADQLATDVGQPMVVDNRPGAGGGIAVQAMRTAPADGLTLMVTASNVLTEIPHVMKTNFDPLKDIKPVATVASASMVLAASNAAFDRV